MTVLGCSPALQLYTRSHCTHPSIHCSCAHPLDAILSRDFQTLHSFCLQVRDAACLACGKFVLAYPAEAREALPRLYERWFDHLTENIPSVRAGAAASLACAAQAYSREALDVVLPRLRCAHDAVPVHGSGNDNLVEVSTYQPIQRQIGQSVTGSAGTVCILHGVGVSRRINLLHCLFHHASALLLTTAERGPT